MTDPTENPGHTPQEPRTKAGRRLLADLPPTWWPVTDGTFLRHVLAIEAEAAAHTHSPPTADELGRALHDELRDAEWAAWLHGGNEARAYDPSTGWCRCKSRAQRILDRIEGRVVA